MPLELEDRLERRLSDMARQAPVPGDWPDLDTRIIPLDSRPPGRHRPVTAVVATAAVIVIVAALAFALVRDPGNPPTRAAATPPSMDAVEGSPALDGHWSATGPRLTDEQLGSIVATVRLADGSEAVIPRLEPVVDGHTTRVDRNRRVTDVVVASTDLNQFGLGDTPGDADSLTGEQIQEILRYLAALSPRPAPPHRGPEALVAVVHTVPAHDVPAGRESGCREQVPANPLACGQEQRDFIWIFLASGARVAIGEMGSVPNLDVLAGLGPVGVWIPDVGPPLSPQPPSAKTTSTLPSSPPTSATPLAPPTTVDTRPSASASPTTSMSRRPVPSSPAPATTLAPDSAHEQP